MSDTVQLAIVAAIAGAVAGIPAAIAAAAAAYTSIRNNWKLQEVHAAVAQVPDVVVNAIKAPALHTPDDAA
jgi:ABC-type phosphate/phosphonate transport system permease subunit